MNWKKWTIRILDLLLLVYLGFAVSSFNDPDDHVSVCTKVNIEIADEATNGFLSPKEIKNILEQRKLYPLNFPMRYIDTRRIETELKSSSFVKEVQCYKTQDGHVCITLTQLLPVIRIQSSNGENYYVDDNGRIMRNDKYAADLIVATGHITKDYAQKKLAPIARYINQSELWSSQVEQLHVLADETIEMVPRVGDHIVYLGEPVGIPEKLERLDLFYRHALNKVGWNKYSYISLEFDNQIICKKKQKTVNNIWQNS